MTTRLYLSFQVNDKTQLDKIVLPADECHYLLRVLRLKAGDEVVVYNERAGEWSGTLVNVTKSSCAVQLQKILRQPIVEPFTRLVYAPLKHDAMSLVFEKGTELGVTHFQPITTDFSQKYNVHNDKVTRQLKQASQQCERLSVPELLDPMPFSAFLESCAVEELVFIAMERSNARSFTETLARHDRSAPCTFIVGPEGGFSKAEKDLVERMPKISCVSLGKTVLRAETAVIVGAGAISMLR
ncbi:MAG: RsmE family RNA methyltransferase [Candidatus Paracaedibacteraceae bacterium]|nr:RsmE family RNA methyltransferase [Candidatus Paracaedibacteraceae bacterium]